MRLYTHVLTYLPVAVAGAVTIRICDGTITCARLENVLFQHTAHSYLQQRIEQLIS